MVFCNAFNRLGLQMVFSKMGKNRERSFCLVFFLSVVVFTNVFAMKRLPLETEEGSSTKKPKIGLSQEEINKKVDEQVAELKENEYLIYDPETGEGVAISKNLLMFSVTMQHLIGDLEMSGYAERKIPLPNSSIESLRLFKEILSSLPNINTQKIRDLKFSELVEITNLITYLELSNEIKQVFVLLFSSRILKLSFKEIEENKEALDLLNPDIKKEVIFSMIKIYMENVEFAIMAKNTQSIGLEGPAPIKFTKILLDQNEKK
jgi:hypothetical protein